METFFEYGFALAGIGLFIWAFCAKKLDLALVRLAIGVTCLLCSLTVSVGLTQ